MTTHGTVQQILARRTYINIWNRPLDVQAFVSLQYWPIKRVWRVKHNNVILSWAIEHLTVRWVLSIVSSTICLGWDVRVLTRTLQNWEWVFVRWQCATVRWDLVFAFVWVAGQRSVQGVRVGPSCWSCLVDLRHRPLGSRLRGEFSHQIVYQKTL